MADLYPVQLPAAGSLTNADILIVQQAGTPTVVEQATIEKVLEVSYSVTTKTTPIAADTFSFFDSVSSTLRKLTWTNLLSALGTTFAALAGSVSQTFSASTLTAAVAGSSIVVENFVTPTLLNSWANSGGSEPAGYFKDAFGIVHLRGLLTSGTVGLAAFTLPTGYRPAYPAYYGVVSNSLFGYVSVTAAGDVSLSSGSNVNFSLAGITFRAA